MGKIFPHVVGVTASNASTRGALAPMEICEANLGSRPKAGVLPGVLSLQRYAIESNRDTNHSADFRIVDNLLITQTLPFESTLNESENVSFKINTFLYHNLRDSFHSKVLHLIAL